MLLSESRNSQAVFGKNTPRTHSCLDTTDDGGDGDARFQGTESNETRRDAPGQL